MVLGPRSLHFLAALRYTEPEKKIRDFLIFFRIFGGTLKERHVRKGATGRRGPFEGMAEHLLPGKFDPPDFALKLARKDVDLAVSVGREFDVPMRLANLTLMEMTEAINRGWGDRDSRVAMLLQEERAGVEVRVDEDALNALLEEEKNG